MEQYKIQELIGGGTFGTVYRATSIKSQETAAIKKMMRTFATELLESWAVASSSVGE